MKVACQLFGQELQSDGTAKFGVLGLVDDTHPTAAQLLDDPVVRNRLADHRKFSTSIRSLPASSTCVYRIVRPSREASIVQVTGRSTVRIFRILPVVNS